MSRVQSPHRLLPSHCDWSIVVPDWQAVTKARRAALEPKYQAYFVADAERAAAMPLQPPPPPRFPREDERRRDRQSFDGGKGYGGKGYGGKGYGGKGYGGKGYSGGRGGGGAPLAPPPDAALIDRPMVTYRDLDAPDDDDLFS